jgi:hypothetical protein
MKAIFNFRITALVCVLLASSYLFSRTVEPAPLNTDENHPANLVITGKIDLELVCVGDDRYAVMAFVDENFDPPAYTIATAGKVTIVVPSGFSYTNLTSFKGGKWNPGAVYLNPPNDQGRTYMTFNLTPDNNQLGFDLTEEILVDDDGNPVLDANGDPIVVKGNSIMLFSLKRVTGKVDTAFLMQDYIPQPLGKNVFNAKGYGLGFGPDIDYEYGKALNRENWNCDAAAQPASSSSPTNGTLASKDTEAAALDAGQAAASNETAKVDLELVCVGDDRYAVMAQVDKNIVPPSYTVATAGKVTIVVPMGFSYTNLTSFAGGKWNPGAVYPNPPNDQGRMYLTFNLTPDDNQLGFFYPDQILVDENGNAILDANGDPILVKGNPIMLFSLKRVTGKVDTAYLMHDYIPQPLGKNVFNIKGLGLGYGPDINYEYGEALNRENWRCKSAAMAAPASPIGGNVAAAEAGAWFRISPNPAKGWVDVSFKQDLQEATANLRVLNLQGQLIYTNPAVNSDRTRLELDNMVPGLYFVVLESQGKVLQREKLVIQ